MDLMRHHSRRRNILVKVAFLVDVMCPRCNYLMASAITHICKRDKERGKKHKCQSRKGTYFSPLSESNEGLLYCKGISLKRGETICCRCIEHLFQHANVNSSFRARKCRNSISGQSSRTLQSSSVWIMVTATAHSSNPKPWPSITGQRSPLKEHGQRGPPRHQLGRARMMRWWATDRRGTVAPRCGWCVWQLARTLRSSVFISHGRRERLRSRGQTELASAGQLMPCERVCRVRLHG